MPEQSDQKKPEATERFVVIPESLTGHQCCFKASVIDMGAGSGTILHPPIAECRDAADAHRICAALNEQHKRKAN